MADNKAPDSKTASAEVIDIPATGVTKVKKSKKGLVKRLSQEKKALTAEEIKANVDAAASREAKATEEKKAKASSTVAKGDEVRTKSQTPEVLAVKKKNEEVLKAYKAAKAEGPEAEAAFLANYKKTTGYDLGKWAAHCAADYVETKSET